MTMVELAYAWADFVEGKNGEIITENDINDFCRSYATSYEEYMTIWEILFDMIEGSED